MNEELGRLWWQQAIIDASDRIEYLENELRAIRDMAHRGGSYAQEALENIHKRASKLVGEENR